MSDVLLVSGDLLFGSRVSAMAREIGICVQIVTPAAAVENLTENAYRCVLLDVNEPQLDVVQIMQALPVETRPAVVAYGPHVATGRLDAARAAGCCEVLTRGQFHVQMPLVLKKYALV